MAERECPRILEKAELVLNPTKELVAFMGRLGEELTSMKGFCAERSCEDCPVGQVRRGVTEVVLNSRQMVVSVVSGAIESLVAIAEGCDSNDECRLDRDA